MPHLLLILAFVLCVGGCGKEEAKKPVEAVREQSKTAPSEAESKSQAPETSAPRPANTESGHVEANAKVAEAVIPASEPNDSKQPDGVVAQGKAGARKTSPAAAFALAEDSRKKATNEARQGNIEAAYGLALSGWEAARVHEDDPACRKLAAELLRDLETYGEQISADSSDAALGSKPLRFE